jgi:hypothetical protein
MWFKKKERIDSAEFVELNDKISRLNSKIVALELDLALYVKKLRASKGLDKKEESENDINSQILPM